MRCTIIVPVFNVEKYLEECLDSIVKNINNEIEVLCVDDGSSDKSVDILDKYGMEYENIKVIHRENYGYGATINYGIELANGKYISIVESDDVLLPNALEELLSVAENFDADIAKGNYINYFCKEQREEYFENLKGFHYKSLLSNDEKKRFYYVGPSIWSAVYKRSFLNLNSIRMLETPGSAFQDTSFAFKVITCAGRIVLLDEPIIRYRFDAEGSSSNQTGKVFDICEEFKELEQFIKERDVEALYPILMQVRHISYMWNVGRLTVENKILFLRYIQNEYIRDYKKGYFKKGFWRDYDWHVAKLIIDDLEKAYVELIEGYEDYRK